ncbi:MAG TPA: DUF177 domain-containing protein [Pseudolabrys sp.]|jgi:uncharacterized metal-binding protein YceD (DUF177 family)|nr:DUF177 domain-containing protein [Pseudolabrys sp.]
MMPRDDRPWSVPVNLEDIPETGSHYNLAADKAARDAVARAAGVRDLPTLEAVFDLSRRDAGVVAQGEVRARVGQTCVVTLEPIENEIREAVDVVFAPSSKPDPAVKPKGEPPEPLENGIIDLGVIATEFLILGLDPYPRKPGAEFASAPVDQKGESPFAALSKLKKRQ